MSTELESRTQAPPAPGAAPESRQATAPKPPSDDEAGKLEKRVRGSARWFHWVAGLSVVNSIVVAAGGSWSFLFGLGATRFVEGMVLAAIEEDPASAFLARYLGLGICLVIAAGYVLLGWLAQGRRTWAFATGMVLYALDGMIFLMFRDFLGLAFHAWALVCLFVGLKACYRYRQTQPD